MRLLIVEDDDTKRGRLEDHIRDQYGDLDVEVARSFQSGLRKILTQRSDLIILDMTMPNFDRTPDEDGGRPHAFGGREIMRQMKREGICIPVIIFTQFDSFGESDRRTTLAELKEELRGKFTNYVGTVSYHATSDEWRDQLDVLMFELTNRRR